MTEVALLAAAVVVGLLIGSLGIGGVALLPVLIFVGGLDAHQAAATSTVSFVLTAAVSTYVYARAGEVAWRSVRRLAAGLVPGALVGALVNSLLPASALLIALALITLFSGVTAWRGAVSARNRSGQLLCWQTAALLGAGIGFASALTGTGGPVLLVPALLVVGVDPLGSVAISQVAQLVLVLAAAGGYLASSSFDLGLAVSLSIASAVGAFAGAHVSQRLRGQTLQRTIAVALLATAALLVARALAGA